MHPPPNLVTPVGLRNNVFLRISQEVLSATDGRDCCSALRRRPHFAEIEERERETERNSCQATHEREERRSPRMDVKMRKMSLSPREKLRQKGRPLAFEGEGGGGEGSEGGAKLNWVSCVGASPCTCTQKDSGTGMKRFSRTNPLFLGSHGARA